MATKLEKAANMLNEQFRHKLDAALHAKFGIDLVTGYSLISMALVSRRADGEDMTPEQMTFLTAYSDGYGEALDLVRAEDQKRFFAEAGASA